jgi:hypothetical protein
LERITSLTSAQGIAPWDRSIENEVLAQFLWPASPQVSADALPKIIIGSDGVRIEDIILSPVLELTEADVATVMPALGTGLLRLDRRLICLVVPSVLG